VELSSREEGTTDEFRFHSGNFSFCWTPTKHYFTHCSEIFHPQQLVKYYVFHVFVCLSV